MADETPEQQIARLTSQVSDLTTANADLQGQLLSSRGELRTVRHRATFKEVALDNGVRPKAVDSLYRLSGYDPGQADEADPAAVLALIESSREDFDFCYEPPAPKVPDPAQKPAPSAGSPPAPPAKPTGLGSGRGKPPASPAKFRVTRADTMNPAWLLANSAAYAEAGRSGNLEIIDFD
jgi:hypothetical protein